MFECSSTRYGILTFWNFARRDCCLCGIIGGICRARRIWRFPLKKRCMRCTMSFSMGSKTTTLAAFQLINNSCTHFWDTVSTFQIGNFHSWKKMSSRYREWDLQCKVYVGNLGSSASKHEIENAFGKYGQLRNVWVARNPPGFAFVEFEDRRDAEDAVRALDGS